MTLASATAAQRVPGRARPRGSGLLGFLPTWALLVLLTGMILASAVVAIGVGAAPIAPARVLRELLEGLAGDSGQTGLGYIVWHLRLPRVLEALVVGAGLAVAGSIVQAIVHNRIADPFTLGISSGASLGAVLVITVLGAGALGALGLPIAAFLGAAAAGVVVFFAAAGRRGLSAGRLVMTGIAVGHLLGGVTSYLILRSGDGEATQQVLYWLLGSLSGATWQLVLISAPVVAVALIVSFASARRLDLMSLGEVSASALGLRPGPSRIGLFALAALLTGTVVSISGTIGFIGLVVPNLARLLVGGLHRRSLPVSALVGALLMLVADTGARTLLAPSELPVGILTAVVGVPVFIAVLARTRDGEQP